jgi:hypothetical protein
MSWNLYYSFTFVKSKELLSKTKNHHSSKIQREREIEAGIYRLWRYNLDVFHGVIFNISGG